VASGEGARSPSPDLSVVLEGRLVRLEPLDDRHVAPLWRAAQDERVWRWMRVRAHESREAFERWLAEVREVTPFATVLRASGEVVGSTSFLNDRPRDRVVEIGHTWLASSAWGRGANTEAKLLLLEHAFEQLGYRRVEFKTDAANERARGALLAIGATFEGVFRKHMIVRDGERRDSAWYSVIDDEWPAVKERLAARLASLPR
jgi:RimJ/RimL family protein N-acetyltransferase